MKIPYTLVSMAAILRDHVDMSNAYKNTEHKRLVDIADSLYNVGIDPEEFLPYYIELYNQYGKPYFDQVLDDMYALDSQLTSDAKVQELIEDYEDRLSGVTASTITCSTDAEIENLWCDLSDVPFDELPDGRLVLAEDWNQFPAGTDREDIWHFFDRNHSKGVAYLLYDFDNLKRCTNASTKVTATKDNSYNQHLVQVSNEDKQYVLNYLNKSHKTVGMGGAGDPGYYVSEFEPAYGLYLWASDTGLRILDDKGIEYTEVKKAVGASTKVTATEDNVTTIYGDYDTTLTIDMWYGDKFVPRKYGADASVYGNGEYRGNIYNESGKIIGDYTSDNSVLIEKNFLIDFGE